MADETVVWSMVFNEEGLGEIQSRIKETNDAADTLVQATTRHTQAQHEQAEAVRASQEALRPLAEGFGDLSGVKIPSFVTGLNLAALSVGGVAAAVSAGAVALTAMGAEWQHTETSIAAAANISVAAAHEIGTAFANMNLPQSAQEVAEAYEQVAGRLTVYTGEALTAEQATEFMRTASEGAIASGQSLSSVTNALTQAMMLSHSSLTDVDDVMNTLYITSRNTGMGMDQVAMVAGRLSARMGDAAPDLRGVGEALTMVNEAGITGQRAMMLVTQALESLAYPNAQAQQDFAGLGIEMQKDSKGGMDFIGTMESLKRGYDSLSTSAERHALAEEVAGRNAGVLESMLKLSDDQIQKLVTDYENHNRVSADAEKHANDLKENMERLGTSAHNAAFEIGGGLATALVSAGANMGNFGHEIDAAVFRLENLTDAQRRANSVLAAEVAGETFHATGVEDIRLESSMRARRPSTAEEPSSTGALASQTTDTLAAASANATLGKEAGSLFIELQKINNLTGDESTKAWNSFEDSAGKVIEQMEARGIPGWQALGAQLNARKGDMEGTAAAISQIGGAFVTADQAAADARDAQEKARAQDAADRAAAQQQARDEAAANRAAADAAREAAREQQQADARATTVREYLATLTREDMAAQKEDASYQDHINEQVSSYVEKYGEGVELGGTALDQIERETDLRERQKTLTDDLRLAQDQWNDSLEETRRAWEDTDTTMQAARRTQSDTISDSRSDRDAGIVANRERAALDAEHQKRIQEINTRGGPNAAQALTDENKSFQDRLAQMGQQATYRKEDTDRHRADRAEDEARDAANHAQDLARQRERADLTKGWTRDFQTDLESTRTSMEHALGIAPEQISLDNDMRAKREAFAKLNRDLTKEAADHQERQTAAMQAWITAWESSAERITRAGGNPLDVLPIPAGPTATTPPSPASFGVQTPGNVPTVGELHVNAPVFGNLGNDPVSVLQLIGRGIFGDIAQMAAVNGQ